MPEQHKMIGAEQSLLGAILIDNRAFERVAHLIGPEDFAVKLHGEIFAAMADRIGAGIAVEPDTLSASFPERTVGQRKRTIVDYLHHLVCEATTIIGVRSCAELIAERAKEPPTTKPGAVFFRRGRAIQRERQPK